MKSFYGKGRWWEDRAPENSRVGRSVSINCRRRRKAIFLLGVKKAKGERSGLRLGRQRASIEVMVDLLQEGAKGKYLLASKTGKKDKRGQGQNWEEQEIHTILALQTVRGLLDPGFAATVQVKYPRVPVASTKQ